MIKYFCDGCKKELTPTELALSASRTTDFAKAHTGNGLIGQVVGEVFCEHCGSHAVEYWTQRLKIWTEASQTLERRLNNHKGKFWQEHKKHERPANPGRDRNDVAEPNYAERQA